MGHPEDVPSTLFDIPADPDACSEWVGMPEYVHDDLGPYASYKIHFRSPEAIQEFIDLIGETCWRGVAFWYPPEPIRPVVGRMHYISKDAK